MKKLTFFILGFYAISTFAQQKEVDWLSFPELEQNLKEAPKPVLIYFYTDWCVYCKKMNAVVFTNEEVINKLNTAYYAVKFNAETDKAINFGNKTFKNEDFGKHRVAYHQIPKYLMANDKRSLEFPAIVILNSKFEIEKRFYRYIAPEEMKMILKD